MRQVADATDLRPALDPGASTAPGAARARRPRERAPPTRRTPRARTRQPLRVPRGHHRKASAANTRPKPGKPTGKNIRRRLRNGQDSISSARSANWDARPVQSDERQSVSASTLNSLRVDPSVRLTHPAPAITALFQPPCTPSAGGRGACPKDP